MKALYLILPILSLSELVTQVTEFNKTQVSLDNIDSTLDLLVTLKLAEDIIVPTTLLLLAHDEQTIAMSYDNWKWTSDFTYIDFESWALRKSTHKIIIRNRDFRRTSSVYTGVFMEFNQFSEYELTTEPIIRNKCVDDCSSNGECIQGDCRCLGNNSGGQNCMLFIDEFPLNEGQFFRLEEGEWKFYRFYLSGTHDIIDISGKKISGDSFVFVNREAPQPKELPSMFNYDIYMSFGRHDTVISESFIKNNEEYWLISVYCHSLSCAFSLGISSKKPELGENVLIMTLLIVIFALLCCCIPIALKLVKNRNQITTVNQNVALQSDQMEAMHPAKQWKTIRTTEDEGVCAICLEEFITEAVVRQLPCLHCFHVRCIDNWATTKASCPLCKGRMGAQEEDQERHFVPSEPDDDSQLLERHNDEIRDFENRVERPPESINERPVEEEVIRPLEDDLQVSELN